jgi:lipopolysaccharide/colanic/teichoic acid biosynthesis glycosyltransferase
MVPNAEEVLRDLLHQEPELSGQWLGDQKLRNDPRVTTMGRFLRRTSVDELPQLWNVLKGEMSYHGAVAGHGPQRLLLSTARRAG